MSLKHSFITPFLIANLVLLGSLPVFADNRDRTLTVMTYNMYPGAEFDEIFAAQSFPEVIAEAAEIFADVQAGNPPARISEIADQIEAASPTLVGLQEAVLWQVGPIGDPASANTVVYDFLEILLGELDERGLHYAPIAVLNNFEAELPATDGVTFAADIRYTDRLVILARTDLQVSQLKIEGVQAQWFPTILTLPGTVVGDITIPRGWTAVDIKMRGKEYRFINTHLESFFDLVQFAQATELLDGPANTDRTVILAGDFNSDAESSGFSYGILTNTGGFTDVWDALESAPGFTWPLFAAPDPGSFLIPNRRIDLILTRGEVRPVDADVLGEDIAADLTVLGTRPSDHAGVAATLVLEP